MKFFGWKSAGREGSRPVLSRGFSTWAGANNLGEWPRAYEPQVRDGYIGNPVAQRAVRLVAESVGSAPVAASDPAALALVAAKSGGQSLVETMALHLLLHGNAYVQVLADADGHPRELFALRPERVTVEADARGWPVAFLYKAGTAVTRLAAEDARGHAAVIHVKTAHPLDDHYGLGCLGAAAGAIAIHNAATRWNKALLDNAARPSGALVYEPGEPGAVLAAEQFARLRAELDASFAGAGNAGRPMLLEGGLKWQSLSLSPADMDFVGLKASAAREIALAFGVPPMLLGLPGDATYANYREANKALWRLSVLPMAGLILDGIAQGLRAHFAGLTLTVDPDKVSALSEDRERLWAQVEAAGFLTLNEKRAAVGLGPVEVPAPIVAPEPEPKAEETAVNEEAAPVEVKFNPWHDPDDGQFTFTNQGTRSGGGNHDAPARIASRPSDAIARGAGAGTTAPAKREKPSARWKRMSPAERLADPEVKAAAQFHAIAQRAVLSDQASERFVYSYSASFAVLLSARRIVRVERIWADGKLLRGSAGDLKVELAELRVHDGGDDQMVDPLIASAEGADASPWRGSAYAVFEGLQLADYGNRIPSLSFEVIADDAPVALGSMLGELAEGVSAEPGPLVVGFAAKGTSVRGVVEAIRPAFPVVCRDEAGVSVRFAPVAGPMLDSQDFGASAGAARVPRIARDIAPLDTTAATLSVAYRDPARDYQAGLQRARREGPGLRDERIDLPAAVAASTAYGIATRALARRGIERRRASIALPWRAMTLRPGDAVTVEGESWRVAETRFERMTVQADLVRAETSVSATGVVDPGRNVAELDAVHGPTTLVVIDLPPLTDSVAATPAIGVFAAGVSVGWRRASLLASTDDGASFVAIGGTALPAVVGTTATVLAPGSSALIDRVNHVEVLLLNAEMALADADTAALLAGANRAMIGNEMIQFGRAQPVSPGRWRLAELWRGRRGTEDAVVAHSAGAPFVLIEEAAVALVPSGQAVAGIHVMGAGIGDIEPYPQATCATAARAVMPLAPVHPTITALASGDTVIAWTRRSRAGWAWRDGLEVPLGEEREAYGVVWAGGSAETVSPDFTYTTAMRAADVASGATTAGFAIRQIGDGALSPPLSVTFTL